MNILILVAILFALLLLRTPIAFALGGSALIFIYISGGELLKPIIVFQQMGSGVESFPLLAIPFFIFAGQLMNASGLTRRLIDFANLLVSRFRGGLAQVNIVSSMLFAGISGSAVADTSAIGSIIIPSMEEEGYDSGFSGAVTASSSVVGPIIPPSIIMIIYATTISDVSVGALFAAGIIPGALLGLGLMVAVYLTGDSQLGSTDETNYELREALDITKDALLALMMPLIILGGILGGVFTATEAGAVASLYGFVIGAIVYRSISLSELYEATYQTAVVSGMVLFIIGTAKPVSWILALEQIPSQTATFLTGTVGNVLLILLVINIILLILGMFIETAANILLWAPVFAPLAVEIGIDPLHFAVIMLLNLAIGMITPPLGVTLFVAASIADSSLEDISKSVVPFILVELLVLVAVVLIQDLSLLIPQLFGY